MCGIIGHIHRHQPVDEVLFNKMRDTLRHRGPDGAGTELLDGGRVAFGHRRLSIIDLSEHGKQPMGNEDGTVWLTFNGEIYNYAPGWAIPTWIIATSSSTTLIPACRLTGATTSNVPILLRRMT